MLIHSLKTEYLTNPSAVEEAQPRLGWRLSCEEGETDAVQAAYRILVASSEEILAKDIGDLWDSGLVSCRNTSQIRYAGKSLSPRQDCFWKVQILDGKGNLSPFSEGAGFRMGLMGWQPDFIYYDRPVADSELAPPVAMGRKVSLREKPARATLYITALGVYNFYINGSACEELILAPEWTSYFYRVQYRALDVTDCLNAGENELIALLGNGWYCGMWQHWPPKNHIYGTHPQLAARLEIEYADGSEEIILADESWRATERIPLTFAGIYEGTFTDARIPFPGVSDMVLPVKAVSHPEISVAAQPNEPIAVSRMIRAKSVTQPKPGVFVADFGENIAGRISLRLFGKAGQKIEIFHNEVLNPDGTVYADNLVAGHFVKDVDRQIVRYICRGDEQGEICRPDFTYMGFRYIEITGLDTAPDANDLAAEVFGSAVEQTAHFSCSDADVNRLQENILRSSRANLMSVPTDCPQRDERCGYTGDMQFFLPTALHNFDMAAFLKKWFVDLCQDSRLEGGCFADHAPKYGPWGPNIGWGEAGIICPYLAWREYGDVENLRLHFEAIEDHMHYLWRTANPDLTHGPDSCGNGDWLDNGGAASRELIATAYFAYCTELMAEMAHALGKRYREGHYRALAKKIRHAFHQNFIAPDGSLIGGGVTGYALAFTMDLLPDDADLRRKTADAFAKAVEDSGCRITTGFIGTPRLLPALHIIGRDDLAGRLLMQRECPSWLYPVTVGATTVWERYNGWTEKDGFADSGMNSFNHFAFGAVGDYFFGGILGINLADPDTHTVNIAPAYIAELSHAEGSRRVYDSEVSVAWKRENGSIRLDVTVGANLTAKIFFGGKEHICGSGSYTFIEE